MATVIDIIKKKRISEYVYTDLKKLNGTALHVWKQRKMYILPKVDRRFEDKVLKLIDFPPSYVKTLGSIIAYHFDRKERNHRKQLFLEGKVNTKWDEDMEFEEDSQKDFKRKRKRIIRKKVRKTPYGNTGNSSSSSSSYYPKSRSGNSNEGL